MAAALQDWVWVRVTANLPAVLGVQPFGIRHAYSLVRRMSFISIERTYCFAQRSLSQFLEFRSDSQERRFSTTLIWKCFKAPKYTHTMPDQKPIWRLVVPIALLALVLGTTFGMVWHHHANTSPETCPLCHLTIAPSPAETRACTLVPIGAGPEPQYIDFVAQSTPRQIPARAPPA